MWSHESHMTPVFTDSLLFYMWNGHFFIFGFFFSIYWKSHKTQLCFMISSGWFFNFVLFPVVPVCTAAVLCFLSYSGLTVFGFFFPGNTFSYSRWDQVVFKDVPKFGRSSVARTGVRFKHLVHIIDSGNVISINAI